MAYIIPGVHYPLGKCVYPPGENAYPGSIP